MDYVTLISVAAGLITVVGGVLGAISVVLRLLQQRQATQLSAAPALASPERGSGSANSRMSRRRFFSVTGIGLVGVGAAGGIFALAKWLTSANTTGKAAPIFVHFTYSTEKAPWLQAATTAFQRTNPTLNGKPIQIVLDERGSEDGRQLIVNGSITPTAWSPASMLEVNQLSADWETQFPSAAPIIPAQHPAQSLVSSPLVLAAWQSRAGLLQQQFGPLTWQNVHQALAFGPGWAGVRDGNAAWGPIKFGQTRPDTSNSGLLTTTLITQSYYAQKAGGHTAPLTANALQNAGAVAFLQVFQQAITMFGTSSGTYVQCALQEGPAAADIIATYENLVLTQAVPAASPDRLVASYPEFTLLSDHPFVILQLPSVTAEEQVAAGMFRDFLLASAQQRQAVSWGFRPANPAVRFDDTSIPQNPFVGQSRAPTAALALAPVPDGATVNALIAGWQKLYPDPILIPGC
jgi:hypothetical protein